MQEFEDLNEVECNGTLVKLDDHVNVRYVDDGAVVDEFEGVVVEILADDDPEAPWVAVQEYPQQRQNDVPSFGASDHRVVVTVM